MSILIISVTILLNKSLSPLKQAQAETIDLAERKADLVEAKDFYWYNGNDTYLTLSGKNSADEEIVVIVKQEGGSIEVFKQEDILSKSEAIAQVFELEEPARILEARMGIHNDRAIWEVSFRQDDGRIGYTMFSLNTGEWIRTIKNI